MNYVAFAVLLVFLVLSYNQWIRRYVKKYGKKAIKCFIEGFIVSMAVSIGWSYLTHFSNMLASTIAGASVLWILSHIWEKYIDKTPDLEDTPMRLLTGLLPYLVAFLTLILMS